MFSAEVIKTISELQDIDAVALRSLHSVKGKAASRVISSLSSHSGATCIADLVQHYAERLLILQGLVWIQYFELNTDFSCFFHELGAYMFLRLHSMLLN